MDILKETMEHFEKKEQEQDRFAGFKSHNIGGMQVIDLTSVDVDYSDYEMYDTCADIERKQIYGNKAGSKKYL